MLLIQVGLFTQILLLISIFTHVDDIFVTIRDGPDSSSPIIYQGQGNRYYYGSYGYGYYYGYEDGFTSSNVFYVEISSESDLGYFYLYSSPNDYCNINGGETRITAPSGTLSCATGTASNSYFTFPGDGYTVEITFNDLALSGTGTDYITFYEQGFNSYTITSSSGGLPPIILSEGSSQFVFSLIPGQSHFSFNYRIVTDPCTAAGVVTLTADSEFFSCINYFDGTYSEFESGYQIIPQNGGDVTLTITKLYGIIAFNIFEGTSTDGGLLYQYTDIYNSWYYGYPGSFTSSGPMYVQLIVDVYDYFIFNVEYTTAINADPCTTSAIADRFALFGTISCPSLPTSSDLVSYWQITPGNGVISVEFNSFDFEPAFATLNFYDDVNNPALIQSFDSTTYPKGFTTSTGSLLVELTISHGPSNKRGPPYNFSFTYTAAASPCSVSTDVLLISPTGSFGCPNGFDSNLHSTWLIAPHNGQINYHFDFLNLWTYYDGLYINIYDGYDNTGILLKTILPGEQYLDNYGYNYWWYYNYFSNPHGPISGSSISDAIFVEFYSDSQPYWGSGFQHFQISYTTLGNACGQSKSITLTEPKGVFGCNTGLNDNIRSSWLINPQNDLVSLVFLKLDLEDGFDYIEIFDGSSPNDPLLGNFTGNVVPTPNAFYSSGNTLLVIVNTDSSLNSGGFELAYTSGVGNPCLSDYNATYTDSFGEFGCPNGIQNDIYSFWTVTVPASQGVIVASFTEFSLELNSDFLYVYDGDNANAPLLATITGSNLPDDVTSSGRSLYFLLVTDATIRSQGFYVKYTSIESDPCQTSQFVTLTKNSDSFGCSEGSIAKSISSSWLITPDNRNIITLSFSVFNLNNGDFIRIYDGTTNSDPLLGSFTGNKVPSFVVSTGSELLVVLTTQSFTSNSVGFRATYTTNQADPCLTSTEITLVAGSGTFGCPNGVRNNVLSSWLIAPISNNKLEITIEFLDLAVGDILTIYDNSTQANPLATLTGRTRSRVYTTTNSVALIVIQTDSSIESQGFNINYVTAIPVSPSPQPILPSATRSPIDFSFTASISPNAKTPSQTPVTITPFAIAASISASRTPAPSTSQIIGSIVPSATASTSVTASASVSRSPVELVFSSSPSNLPIFSITPFSPSANPSATASANPVRVVTDVETMTVQLECRTSGATCCNNFETVWASVEDKNYPTLVEVNSCIYNDGTVTVHFDQYGSNFFTVEEILKDYWADGGCEKQDPLSGEECSVSTSALDVPIWNTQIMVVDSIPATPSPLPSYYYYYASSTSGSSVLSGLSSILFVALSLLYLAF